MQFQQKRSDPVLWFNVISLILLSIPNILTIIQTIQPEWAVLADAIGALILGVGNNILRIYFTDKPLDTARNRAKMLPDQSGEVVREV